MLRYVFFLTLLISGVLSAEKSKLTMGMILPLSGDVARMGTVVRNGVDLYNQDNPDFSKVVRLLFEDGQYDGRKTSTSFVKLVDQDKAQLLYVWGNTPAAVAAPLAERYKIPTLLGSMEDHSANNRYVAELGTETKPLVAELARAVQDVPTEKLMEITIDIGTAISGLDALDSVLGRKPERVVVPAGTSDFRPFISRAKRRGVTTMVVFLLPEQALALARQAKEQKYQFKVVGGDVFADPDFILEVSKLLPEVAVVYGAITPWFKQRYRQQYGNISYLLEAASGYAAADIGYQIAKKRKVLAGPSMFEMLTKLSMSTIPFQGAFINQRDGRGAKIHCDVSTLTVDDFK